jgi:hypothetical protein
MGKTLINSQDQKAEQQPLKHQPLLSDKELEKGDKEFLKLIRERDQRIKEATRTRQNPDAIY